MFVDRVCNWDDAFAPTMLASVFSETNVEVHTPAAERDDAGDPLPVVRASNEPKLVIEPGEEEGSGQGRINAMVSEHHFGSPYSLWSEAA